MVRRTNLEVHDSLFYYLGVILIVTLCILKLLNESHYEITNLNMYIMQLININNL
jgi:hypothetical protein